MSASAREIEGSLMKIAFEQGPRQYEKLRQAHPEVSPLSAEIAA
jgi:hypothetical protein